MKLLLLPPESYPEIPQEIRVPSARTRNKAIFMVDPSPALSEYHCHELMQHAKMYRIAEFYQLETLKETATSSFFKVVCDCWNSTAKLDVVRYVYGISVDKNKLRLIIVDELTDRVNSLRNSIAFKALLNEIPALAVDLIWNMCMHPPVLSSATDTRYCTFFDCRKTRSTLGSFRSERTVTNDEGEEVMVPILCALIVMVGENYIRRKMIFGQKTPRFNQTHFWSWMKIVQAASRENVEAGWVYQGGQVRWHGIMKTTECHEGILDYLFRTQFLFMLHQSRVRNTGWNKTS